MDNTLYDWVSYFVPAVHAMLAVAARVLDADENQLRSDLRAVHVAHGNTEHPFALLETQAVASRLPTLNRRERHDVLKPAFDAFNEVRKDRLQLYPGVRETLHTIKAAGCRLFGHTEATEVNIASRVRSLGLEELLEAVYAVQFEGMPHPLVDERGEPNGEVLVRAMRSTARKPDPRSINPILLDTGVAPGHCLYVGDNLAKDVGMAKQAGILAAWARYGTIHDPQLWRDLVAISHWVPAAVAAVEDNSTVRHIVEPDVAIDAFDELLSHFTFSAGQAA
jgi:phosphoglycolate phosphatase-like HAD superfamily hydrolase